MRKEDGSEYPLSTIRSHVSGINRVIKSNNMPFSALDKGDYRFRDLLKTLDSVSSDLHHQGIGANRNSSPVIDSRDENLFWEILVIVQLRCCNVLFFFYIGLNFILWGTQEQYDLISSQFQRVPADHAVYNETMYYEYTEYISKNN